VTTLDQAPPQMIRPPGPAPSPWLHRILLANVVVEVLIVVTGAGWSA